MSEPFTDNLDRASDVLRDKKDKGLSKEQVFVRLSRTLNSHDARIDGLPNVRPDQKEKLKADTKAFLLQSVQNTLLERTRINGTETNVLAEYNFSSVDTDREPGLDAYEFNRYMANLEEALRLIVELGGVEKFRKEMGALHKETYEATTISKMNLFGDRDEKSPMTRNLTEWFQGNVNGLTPEQIKDYTNAQFRGDKMKFAAGLAIALGNELGPEAVEVAINFVYDLGKAIMQFPEYVYFGFQFNRATTEIGKKEYSLKMKSRLDDNMALGLLALAYDGTADATSNLFGANISADAKGSRFKDLVHRIGSPDTWTPAGIKEAIIGLAPFLPKLAKGMKRSAAWEVGKTEPGRNMPPPNPNQEKPGPTERSAPARESAIVGAVAAENIHRVNSWEISPNNPKTAPLAEKMASPETNVVKERKLEGGKTIKYETGPYLEAYKEGLERVGELLRDTKDWVLMSSNAMYANLREYRMLPDDFDVVIRDKDFWSVYDGLKKAESEGKIRGLEIHSIDKTHVQHVAEPAKQWSLLESGNLKIVFYLDTANGIPMEVEMFAEGKGKGLTQLGYIPRTIESFTLNGKEIKVSGVFDLADTYAINLMDEIFKNSVERYGEKAKDGARIYNLTHYLRKTGIENPRDLLAKMDEVAAKYRKHAEGQLAPGLEAIFARLPEVKERLWEIIEDYELKQEFGYKQKGWLPDFQEFIETWSKEKSELHKLHVEATWKEKLSTERMREIQGQLQNYQNRADVIMNRSLNNGDFAYFYEMSIIKAKFIQRIRDALVENSQK